MSYYIRNLIEAESSYALELSIVVIVGILLVLAIVILTIIKYLKDK